MKTKILSIAVLFVFGAFTVLAADTTDTFKVKGGDCNECKKDIESAAVNVIGVSMAHWNSEKQELRVIFDDSITNLEDIEKAVAKAGHDTSDYKAKDEDFNKLPECCKYERNEK